MDKNERVRKVPNWRVHLEIAKKLNEQIKFNDDDFNLFLLGNIAPDINNGYIVKDVSHIYDHGRTHLYKEHDGSTYVNFYDKYKEYFKTNPVIFGYFTHLYTDYLLNKAYDAKCDKNHWDKEECIKVKHKDLRKYDKKYIDNTIILKDYEEAVKDLNKIEEVTIEKDDISKVINFLDKKENEGDTNLEFYTFEELDKEVEDITNQIYKFIEFK